MSVFKVLARSWLPPVLVGWLRRGRGDENRFHGDFETWGEANSHSTGYDAEEILAKVLASTLKVKHDEAAFERDSVLFESIEYAWPVLAGLMWAAARSGGVIRGLGGGGMLKHGNEFHAAEFAKTADVIQSVPPDAAKKKVTNIYIEFVDGSPKLRVEYEDE